MIDAIVIGLCVVASIPLAIRLRRLSQLERHRNDADFGGRKPPFG